MTIENILNRIHKDGKKLGLKDYTEREVQDSIDVCKHYKIANDKLGTTACDIHEYHKYYECKICEDPKNLNWSCFDYKSTIQRALREYEISRR